MGVDLYSQTKSNSKHQEVVRHYIFKENVNLHVLYFCAFLWHENKEK